MSKRKPIRVRIPRKSRKEEKIEGVRLVPGDRFVLLDQPDPGRDGVYTIKAGRWPGKRRKR